MKRINFFALRNDLISILTRLEEMRTIAYSASKDSSEPIVEQFETGKQLPNLGKATADQWINCDSYLIAGKSDTLRTREFRLVDGTIRYSIDQMLNEHTVVLQLGGLWKDGAIIGSSIATISNCKPAQDLMHAAKTAIKKSFVRVNAFCVGPEALLAFRGGARLTTAIQSPTEYDLRE
jgi:hypothetical protein